MAGKAHEAFRSLIGRQAPQFSNDLLGSAVERRHLRTQLLVCKCCTSSCYQQRRSTTGRPESLSIEMNVVVCGAGLSHSFAGCSVLAQRKYLARHNNALKVLFLETHRTLYLGTSVGPCYSEVQPKLGYENERATTYIHTTYIHTYFIWSCRLKKLAAIG